MTFPHGYRRTRSRSSQPPYPVPVTKPYNYVEPNNKENNPMSDYTYTDTTGPVSSEAVKNAYYNQDDKTLLVVMRENGNAYRYDGVPSWVWNEFKRARSLGRYFATTIKRDYGPSKYLGVGKNLDIAKKGVSASLSYGQNTTATAPAYVSLGVGTPKGLSYASDAKVTTKAEAFPLATAPVAQSAPVSSAKRKHEVVFSAVGATSEKSHVFDVDSVDEAVAEITKVADMLGVALELKRVVVHFE